MLAKGLFVSTCFHSDCFHENSLRALQTDANIEVLCCLSWTDDCLQAKAFLRNSILANSAMQAAGREFEFHLRCKIFFSELKYSL